MTSLFESEPESFAIQELPALNFLADWQEPAETTAGRSMVAAHVTDTSPWPLFLIPAKPPADRTAGSAGSQAAGRAQAFLAGRTKSINLWI